MVVSELPRWDLEFWFSPFLSEKFIQAIKKSVFFLIPGYFCRVFLQAPKTIKRCKLQSYLTEDHKYEIKPKEI